MAESTDSMDRDAVRGQIDKILRSKTLAGKDQLRRLLEVLWRNWDSQSTLQPYRVIKELWGENADVKRSSNLATEMGRLRKELEIYYSDEGTADPVTIWLPNRARPGVDGQRERRWIDADDREVIETPPITSVPELAAPEPSAPFRPSETPSDPIISTVGDAPSDPPGSPAPPVLQPPDSLIASRARMHWGLKLATLITVVGLAVYFTFRLLSSDGEPQFGRLDGATLTVMNAEGKELWHKNFPDGFSHRYYEQGLEPKIWFGDLEGDGHAEVLLLYQPSGAPEEHSTTLICYSNRGNEKWRWTPGKDLPEMAGSPSYFVTERLAVLKANAAEKRRIVVSSHHHLFYPHQIAIVDTNGKTISEYWHSGMLEYLTLADLDGDGHEEIIASGISNGYREATLIVLDPDHVSGASLEAARPELQLHGMGPAHERLRLVFPRSDLNIAQQAYNRGRQVILDRDRIRFDVLECQAAFGIGCAISYEFDRKFNLRQAVADDLFRGAHKQFYLNRKDNHPFSAEEEAQFQKITCLVGCSSDLVPIVSRESGKPVRDSGLKAISLNPGALRFAKSGN